MSVLLYAIVPSSSTHVAGEGLDGRALRRVTGNGLSGVVSDHEALPATSERTLWAYEHAIEALMANDAVLPARFGTAFDDDPGVQAMLGSRHDELRAALERVRGAVELGVRASWPATADEPPPAGPSTGTAYMLGRLELSRRAREIAAKLEAELGALARARSSRLLARPATPVLASYLVEHKRIEEFRTRVHELDVTTEEADIVCTGPWPPYSFVEGGRS
jgi:hypothetical protein